MALVIVCVSFHLTSHSMVNFDKIANKIGKNKPALGAQERILKPQDKLTTKSKKWGKLMHKQIHMTSTFT